MSINISGHHLEISNPLKDYIHTKMNKILRHTDNIADTFITLSIEKHRQKAEATIRGTGAKIFAQAESDDMYASIDSLMDKLDRQVLKHKEKQHTKRQSNH